MPKMKTKRTLAKRVKRTGSQVRQRRGATLVSPSDYKRIKHLLQD